MKIGSVKRARGTHVMVANPDPRIRLMLRALLEGVVDEWEESASAESVVTLVAELRPDWLVVGGFPLPWNPLALLDTLERDCPSVKIILLAEAGKTVAFPKVLPMSSFRGWVGTDEILEVRRLILKGSKDPISRNAG